MKTVLSIMIVLAVLFLSGCAGQLQVPLDSTETTSFSNSAPESASKGADELCENTERQSLSFQEGMDSPLPEVEEPITVEMKPTEITNEKSEDVLRAENTATEGVPQQTEPAKPTAPEPEPTAPPKPTEHPKPTEPAPTEPSPAETAPTVSVPTEPQPTEPAGCTHDWVCIQHSEEGHWKAGIVCDCGWTVYGSPDEVSAAWNAHSASFPPEESLIMHGGYGCVDEWVVDAPAYEEWYCSLCGKQMP